jgi:murein DD-endopeptidase MepM/ murein hydrolase activator NlpD
MTTRLVPLAFMLLLLLPAQVTGPGPEPAPAEGLPAPRMTAEAPGGTPALAAPDGILAGTRVPTPGPAPSPAALPDRPPADAPAPGAGPPPAAPTAAGPVPADAAPAGNPAMPLPAPPPLAERAAASPPLADAPPPATAARPMPAPPPPSAVPLAATPPPPAEDPPETEPAEQTLTVGPGDTLIALLVEAGVDRAEAHAALTELGTVFPPQRVRPGQEVTIRTAAEDDSRLLSVSLDPAPGHTVLVERRGEAWAAEEARLPETRHLARIATSVDRGVFPALVEAGLPPGLAHSVVRALSHRVDFQRDIQPGDTAIVAFERLRGPDGELLRHGRVLHARLTLSGRAIEVWRRDTETGTHWYDTAGRPLAGGLLRTPLDGARISSRFGLRRHPILGYTRMHRGVDFAAPTGTPVYAAADGVVESVRRERGYGNVVRLRHQGGMMTLYAHLSRFAPGLRAGQRVRQGQTIARVGSTGMSTGPHLHYEIHVAGRAVNPAVASPPPPPALAGRAASEFHAARQALSAQIALLARGREEIALAAE